MGPSLGTETVIRRFSAGWVTQEDLGVDKPYLGRGQVQKPPGYSVLGWAGEKSGQT